MIESNHLLLSAFAAVALLAAVLYQVGFLGWVVGHVGRAARATVNAGFDLWRRLFAWLPWPLFLAAVLGLHALAWSRGEVVPWRALLCGLALLVLGVVACLAYVFIDLERYEVGRGYKALHNPLKGQQLAGNLARYGHRVGVPLLAAAAVAVIGGFSLLNEGLYYTVGEQWYALDWKPGQPRPAERAPDQPAPGFGDFLAYTLINLTRVVDLLDLANTYNYGHVTYVRQARWPASTLLVLFKTFFTAVLLQQIFASVRRGKLLAESVQDFWSPHPPIQERARGSLAQHGAGVVEPLFTSLRGVEFLTAGQREQVPQLIAEIGTATVPALVKYLYDPNENVRAVAVAALGHLHALDALPRLVRLQNDPSEWVRQGLVDALGTVCGPGTGVLRKRWSIRLSAQGSRRWVGWVFRWKRRLTRGATGPVDLAVTTLRALLADPVPAIRGRAARTLGDLGEAAAAAVPDLVGLLGDAEESVCCQAAESLGQVGGPAEQVVPGLTALFRSPSETVRVAAAGALAARKGEAGAALPALAALLHDPDEPVRRAAAEAIGQIGTLTEEAVPRLVAGLSSEDNVVRAQTAEVLGEIGSNAAVTVPALVKALQDPNDPVRARAAEALGKMGDAAADAVPSLVRALRDDDNRVCALAARALGELGEVAAPAALDLAGCLRHINARVRANAAEALGRLGPGARPGFPALAEAVRDQDGGVRGAAVRALGRVAPGEPSEQAVLGALQDRDPEVRAAAVEALGNWERVSEDLVGALLRALADASDPVKIEATRVLPRLVGGTPAVLAGLCRLLQDDTPEVQAQAAAALGRLGPEATGAGEALLRILQTGEAEVREQALRALAMIQPEQAATAFRIGLKDAEADIRKLAAAGLLKAPAVPPEVVPDLIEALRDPEAQVRSNAAQVLSRLEALPLEAVPLLLDCTADADDGLRLNATRALKATSPDALGPVLLRLVEDSNVRVRLLAARFLLIENPAHPGAGAVLLAALADAAVGLRKVALGVVEALGPQGVVFLGTIKQQAETETEPEVRALLGRLVDQLERQAAPGTKDAAADGTDGLPEPGTPPVSAPA